MEYAEASASLRRMIGEAWSFAQGPKKIQHLFEGLITEAANHGANLDETFQGAIATQLQLAMAVPVQRELLLLQLVLCQNYFCVSEARQLDLLNFYRECEKEWLANGRSI